jgi:putative inorganic carbon (hco3(-)) transporter
MRDLILTAIVFGSVPFILRNPFVGLLMWIWLGLMNPHRLTWGFAFDMPFAQIVAICTLVSILFNQKKLSPPPHDRVVFALVMFFVWLNVSPLFAFHPEDELALWLRAIKVQFMCLIALVVVGNRNQLHKLIWVLALSIGVFGIKGGIFTILTGGGHRVWGPAGSFIADNNQLALAVIMTIPLFNYLRLQSENKWIQRACATAMILSFIGALGSQSRGALLGLIAMGALLFLKSRHKGPILILLILAVPVVLVLMPESWMARMSTIQTYEQDASAMGRINTWIMAWNLAVDRFPIGGGFGTWALDVFQRYAPDPSVVLVAHSIYFHMLGDHGFVGLILFLAIFGFAWLNGSWVIRISSKTKNMEWARDLAAMCQVSLIGYLVGGAFLSLTYFDLPYYVVVSLILVRHQVAFKLDKDSQNIGRPAALGVT